MRHTIQIIFFLCFIWGIQNMQGQSLKIAPYLGLGYGSMKVNGTQISPASNAGLGFQVGLKAYYLFTENLGVGLGVGLGSYRFGLSVSNYESPWHAVPVSESDILVMPPAQGQKTAYSRKFFLSQDDQLQLNRLEIPLLFRYQASAFYVEGGPLFGLPLGDMTLTGTGNIDYRGLLGDVEVDHTGLGFNEFSLNASGTEPLPEMGFSVDFWLGAGYRLNINEQMALELGLGYAFGTNMMDGAEDPLFFQRKEGTTSYMSLLSASNSMALRLPAVQADLQIGLGGGGNRDYPVDDRDCPPEAITNLEARYVQADESRRSLGEMDPEFSLIARSEKSKLSFDVASYNSANDQLTFCLVKNRPEEIRGRFKERNAYLQYIEGRPSPNELYEIELFPRTLKNRLNLRVVGPDQEAVSYFDLEVLYNQQTIFAETLQEGAGLPHLYAHPLIQYDLIVKSPCYADKILTINEAQIQSGSIEIPMERTGRILNLSLPLIFNSFTTILDEIPVQGLLSKGNTQQNLVGKAVEGEIRFSGGCGPDMFGRGDIVLQKPRGYDLYLESESPKWRSTTIKIPIFDGAPLEPIHMDPLKQYHLIYLSLPTSSDRQAAQNYLRDVFQDIQTRQDLFYCYLSDGSIPIILQNHDDLPYFLEDLGGALNSSGGDPAQEREQIMADNDLYEIGTSRRQIIVHMLMPSYVLEVQKDNMKAILDIFGKDLQNAEVRIYTDLPVPKESRWEGDQYEYKTW